MTDRELGTADHLKGIGLAMRALQCRVIGDTEGASDAVGELMDLGGVGYLFCACGTWAELVNRLSSEQCDCCEPHPDNDGFVVGFEVRDKAGNILNPDELPDEAQPRVWAARFVAATGNNDKETMYALFSAMDGDDDEEISRLSAGVTELLNLTAITVRDSMKRDIERAASTGHRVRLFGNPN